MKSVFPNIADGFTSMYIYNTRKWRKTILSAHQRFKHCQSHHQSHHDQDIV